MDSYSGVGFAPGVCRGSGIFLDCGYFARATTDSRSIAVAFSEIWRNCVGFGTLLSRTVSSSMMNHEALKFYY